MRVCLIINKKDGVKIVGLSDGGMRPASSVVYGDLSGLR